MAATGPDVVAIVDHDSIAMPILEGRDFKGSPHEENFFFPKGIDRSGSEAVRTDAAIGAFGDGAGGKLAIVVSKGALSFLPAGFGWVETRGEPVFHSLGQGHFAVARDELIKGNLLGWNRVEGMVGPFGGAKVGKHGPVEVSEASTVVKSGEPIENVAFSAGSGGLGFGGGEFAESDPVLTDKLRH